MTAPLRSTPHPQRPASQTAPVAEFRCLYTPDIRKKQKKWQDGYLKFHTFNNRVMVYDQARNFLGDTYYKDSNELHEGDELTLDKGVMVEVADAVGVTQTDLKPLFEKKPKDAPPLPTAPPRRFQPPSQLARPQPAPSTNAARAAAQQLRHKSLDTLLGTPKGPIGKSLPIKSPYEARQEKEREKENDFAVDRAAKRQKTTHKSTSSATLRLSSPAQDESLPPCPKTSGAKAARKPARPIPHGAPVITLDELDAVAHVSSDASLPGTPPALFETASRPAATPAQPAKSAVATKPVVQTPKLPRGKVPVPSVKALDTPQAPAPPSSPPVSASNRLTNVDFAIKPTPARASVGRLSKQPSPEVAVDPPKSPPQNPKPKSLRLSKGVKRGTLMICQPQPPPLRSRDSGEARAKTTKTNTVRDINSSRRRSPALPTVTASEGTSTRLIVSKSKRKATAEGGDVTHRTMRLNEKPSDDFEDDQEVFHGLVDQQILTTRTPPPEPSLGLDNPEQVISRPKAAKSTANGARRTELQNATDSDFVRAASPPAQVSPESDSPRKPPEKPRASRQTSPPAVAIAEAAEIQSRAASPALCVVPDTRSRTASLSPRKLAALSTGGFSKLPKRVTPQPTHPASDKSLPAPRNETVALPPHPLRANKKGPVMTTTELAAMLQQPKKRPKAAADPIEDGVGTAETSPNRKFRRVRSENDAPIPSISEDWELRNLPKASAIAAGTEPIIAAAAPQAPAAVARKKPGLAALIKKTDPRKKSVRTQSLSVETSLPPAQETESPMVSPVADEDIGPWSTEAFDLFDWRPPGREGLGS